MPGSLFRLSGLVRKESVWIMPGDIGCFHPWRSSRARKMQFPLGKNYPIREIVQHADNQSNQRSFFRKVAIGLKSTFWSYLRSRCLVWHGICRRVADLLTAWWPVIRAEMRKEWMEDFMKLVPALAATVFAFVGFPILGQQQPTGNPPSSPSTQQTSPSTQAAPSNSPAASAETSTQKMNAVNAELVSRLDSKTAKAGDSVVVETKGTVKVSDGTEIPKGAKLMGHVVGVQPSGEGKNSQVAIQFDHVEIQGGQSLAVHSQIESIGSSGSAVSDSGSSAMPGASSSPTAVGAPSNNRAGAVPPTSSSDSAAAPAGSAGPAAGTVVAKNGNIAIVTTSIPGVLLANNAPGQVDPRMAQASSILLGAKKDILLDGGTKMVVGLSASGGGGR